MRRKYDLYINLQRADVNADALVLMNYKMTDAESPAAVFNSWSQQLALPRTSRNNAIFDHIYRADHRTVSGKFNPLERTPFEIISETGEKLEAGYLKLTDISETEYTVVLYGGLGGFLFSLMYNADGSKKSLADLQYTDGGGDGELDFNITRDAVREAWRTIGGQQAHSALWNIINFAPCYNGIPGGDFDSKKAFCYNGCYGVKASDGGYNSRRSHVMVNLVNAVDEWAAQDLRSYQQRPVISFKAILTAIRRFATAAGYTLYYDPVWYDSSTFTDKLWLTLPKLDGVQLPNESGSGSGTFNGPTPGAQPTFGSGKVSDTVIEGPWTSKGYTAKHSASVTLTPRINVNAVVDVVSSYEAPDSPSGRRYWRIVAAYQLLALDGEGVVVGGSKVAMATTKTRCVDGATPKEETVTPASFIRRYNDPVGGRPAGVFSPSWMPEDGDVYEATMHNGRMYDNGKLVDDNLEPVNITLSFENVAGVREVRLRTTYLAIYSEIIASETPNYYQNEVTSVPFYQDMDYLTAMLGLSFMNGATDSYTYSVSGTAHSGSLISKKTLLGGTHTPADYLLSLCKMYGLYFITSDDGKTIEIRQRSSAYHLTDPVLDFQTRIDRASVKVTPYVIRSRWYDWVQETAGRFADYYKSVYGQDYGMARVNTGFEFDASHTDVLKGCIFKGAAEVLKQSKYFENITEGGKACPPPFIDGGTFTLWNSAGEGKDLDVVTPSDAAAIEYINQTFLGYDYLQLPKPEFCDKDGKELDGSDVLLLYDASNGTAYYRRFCLTDDNGLMTLYNEGKPCWLLGQAEIASNLKYTINNDSEDSNKLYLPRFRRMMTGSSSPMTVTRSLDMGVPQEIDQPAITVPESVTIYVRRWKNFMMDRLNVDTKVMTCKADLRGLQVGRSLLGRICFYDGSLWALEGIKNYVLGGDQLTECELVKVNDINNYYTGQN